MLEQGLRKLRSSPIRIVHVITGLDTGGAERMLEKLVRASDPAGFEHTVVSVRGDGPVGETLRQHNRVVVSLGIKEPRDLPRGLSKLVRLLRAQRPHIVQTWLYHADFIGTLAARLAGTPRLAWNLRNSAVHSRFGRAALPALGTISRLPDVVLVNSQAGKVAHERAGYRPRRWELVPNGFDLDDFHPDPMARGSFRRELGLAEDALVAVHVARFHPNKGHTFVIEAATQLLTQSPVHFVLMGRGVDASNPALTAPIAKNELGKKVHLLGERDDVPRILAAADVFVSSSTIEGFPNAIGEAMSCELPCVVTDVGDSASIIGSSGIVVPPGNPTALAQAVLVVLQRPPEIRRQAGQAARRRVAEFYGLPAVLKRYESIYTDLVATLPA